MTFFFVSVDSLIYIYNNFLFFIFKYYKKLKVDFCLFCSSSTNIWLLLNFRRVSSLLCLCSTVTATSVRGLQTMPLSPPVSWVRWDRHPSNGPSPHKSVLYNQVHSSLSKGWNWELRGVLLNEPHCSKERYGKGKQMPQNFLTFWVSNFLG